MSEAPDTGGKAGYRAAISAFLQERLQAKLDKLKPDDPQRDAVIASFRRIGKLRGVVHSFSGSPEQAHQLWQLGFLIGIGGPATYQRANRLRGLVTTMPLDFLLLETDAPDQPDADIRGQRNEPARLAYICETIAQLRCVHTEVVAQATSRNARQLFNLPEVLEPK